MQSVIAGSSAAFPHHQFESQIQHGCVDHPAVDQVEQPFGRILLLSLVV